MKSDKSSKGINKKLFRTGGRIIFLSVLAAACLFSIFVFAYAENGSATGVTERGIFEMKRWSPYIVGMGIGVLSWFAFLLSDHPIGASTAYANTAGMLEKFFAGKEVEEKAYYKEYVPRVSWTWMLVAGLIAGSFVSASASGDFRIEWVPSLWESRFGFSPVIRLATAFTGGIILGIGARWADGCTSGHGISGTLQLVFSSWVAAVCFFIAGSITAYFIY